MCSNCPNAHIEHTQDEFIELIKTENEIKIRNLSMFITKSFEIRKKPLF